MVENKRNKKYIINENYFSVLDTEEKAYWLGFIAADGSLDDKSELIIQLHSKDHSHLEKFICALESNHPIKQRKDKKEIHSRLCISNKKLTEDLNRLGIHPRKSFTLGKLDIKNELLPYFFRGYFDGDGSLYKTKAWAGCSTVGTEEFISWMRDFFVKELSLKYKNIDTHITKKGSKVYYLRFDGRRITNKFMDILYNNASIYLDRKYSLYKELFKSI